MKTSTPTQVPGIFYRQGHYVIDHIKSVKGKRIHIYKSGFLTFEAAKHKMPGLIERKLAQANASFSSPLFEDFVKEYKRYRLNHVRPSTLQQIDSMARVHMKAFLRKPISQTFNPQNIRKWYEGLLGDDSISTQWKNKIISACKKMFEMAWKWKYLPSDHWADIGNILESVQESKRRTKEKKIWTPSQLNRFLSVLPEGSDDQVMFHLFCTLGARISEFAGLTWDCLDKKKGTIEIKQQVIYIGLSHFVLTEELKTSESYRHCKLDQKTLALLLRYEERQKPNDPKEFIFPSSPYNHYRPTAKSTLRRKMETYIQLAKVPRITPHGIRHTKATMLMAVCKNMAEVKAAARFLGHSATMMVDTYGHAREDSTALIVQRLEKR